MIANAGSGTLEKRKREIQRLIPDENLRHIIFNYEDTLNSFLKNDKRMMNDKDNIHHSVFLGSFQNVDLTDTEYLALRSTYERTDELIDKVSIWLRGAEHDVPDHYALCVKFANNDKWPRRKEYVPPTLPEVNDPIDEVEQQRLVAEMHEKLNGAVKTV